MRIEKRQSRESVKGISKLELAPVLNIALQHKNVFSQTQEVIIRRLALRTLIQTMADNKGILSNSSYLKLVHHYDFFFQYGLIFKIFTFLVHRKY